MFGETRSPLSPDVARAEAGRADMFFEDMNVVFERDLKLPLLYVASSNPPDNTPAASPTGGGTTTTSATFFQGLARSDAALVRVCTDSAAYVCKDGDLSLAKDVEDGKEFGGLGLPYVAVAEPRDLTGRGLVGMPLSRSTGAVDGLDGKERYVRDAGKNREFYYNAGKKKAGAGDPRKEAWFARYLTQLDAYSTSRSMTIFDVIPTVYCTPCSLHYFCIY